MIKQVPEWKIQTKKNQKKPNEGRVDLIGIKFSSQGNQSSFYVQRLPVNPVAKMNEYNVISNGNANLSRRRWPKKLTTLLTSSSSSFAVKLRPEGKRSNDPYIQNNIWLILIKISNVENGSIVSSDIS